jgi:hypothetical protein
MLAARRGFMGGGIDHRAETGADLSSNQSLEATRSGSLI